MAGAGIEVGARQRSQMRALGLEALRDALASGAVDARLLLQKPGEQIPVALTSDEGLPILFSNESKFLSKKPEVHNGKGQKGLGNSSVDRHYTPAAQGKCARCMQIGLFFWAE